MIYFYTEVSLSLYKKVQQWLKKHTHTNTLTNNYQIKKLGNKRVNEKWIGNIKQNLTKKNDIEKTLLDGIERICVGLHPAPPTLYFLLFIPTVFS
jgi:hypothetical protein